MKIVLRSALMAMLLVCMQPGSSNAAEDEVERAREYFTNLELINQDGETVRFFDDVLRDKVVVINFVFTNCQGACPLMTFKLSQVRDQFEGEIGDPLQFVSLSIDPERDTPAAMKAFAQEHKADHEGWVWLTGNPDHLDVESHSTMMLAGNVSAAHWVKIQPYEMPPQIVQKVALLLEDG